MSNIVELNKDAEQYVIQASIPRSRHNFGPAFGDHLVPLEFVHTSDMHADLPVWNRMVEYVNHYEDYISFVLHTGDYCGGSQQIYVDCYQEGIPCSRPILNCVGNHDCFPGDYPWHLGEKETVHKLLFNHTENWGVTFMDCDHAMSYYKDFPQSNIRLIVLDQYYDLWPTRAWLKGLLEDALDKGIHVITAMHEPTDYIVTHFGIKYDTLDDYQTVRKNYELARTAYDFDHRGRVTFEDVITWFISKGGHYVCNLVGHNHTDEFGLTAGGLLNVVVQNGTTWDAHGDMKRVEGTRSMDCFNVVSVDTELGLLKIVRIGANVDHYLRKKTALCFDYRNQKVISDL